MRITFLKSILFYQLQLAILLSVTFFYQQAFAKKSVSTFLGNHSRLVWLQDQADGTDTLARGKNLMLYGYDSEDGKGERPINSYKGNLFKPLLGPDGKYVIVSNRKNREIFTVNWESGKMKKLSSGVAVAIWNDPKPSRFLRATTTWVYCLDGLQPENKYGSAQPLYRFPLNNPKKKELIWDGSNLAWSNLQLSRDGELIGGLFPWPHGGVLWADEKRWERLGRGCWTSLSPDNSKLLWIFDGLHRNIQVHDVVNKNSWKININNAPGVGGYEVYHPRWSNHPQYFVITGPYEKGEGRNKLYGGGEKVEVYIGKFNESITAVDSWIQVTTNNKADFYPDLWVEDGDKVDVKRNDINQAKMVPEVTWPVEQKNLLFVWDNMKAPNQLAEESPLGFYQCNIELRGKALHNKNLQLETHGGWADTGDAGSKIAIALQQSQGASIEFLIHPQTNQKGTILAFKNKGQNQLTIAQKGESITIVNKVTGKKAQWNKVFKNDIPLHGVLLFTEKYLELLVNGRSLKRKSFSFDNKKFSADSLILGDNNGSWHSTFQSIAVYNTPLTYDTIAKHAVRASRINNGLTKDSLLIIKASLGDRTEIPQPDSIGAYSRALVFNVYEIDDVLSGKYKKNKILVAEWAVLDRKIVKNYSETSKVEQLVLEKFDDHPELEGERQLMDVFEPDLETYYRVNSSSNQDSETK